MEIKQNLYLYGDFKDGSLKGRNTFRTISLGSVKLLKQFHNGYKKNFFITAI